MRERRKTMNGHAGSPPSDKSEKEFEARKQEFFALFGHLASRFSAADALVGCLLEYLIDPKHPLPGGLVTRKTSDPEKVKHVRELAVVRYPKSPATAGRIKDLMKAVEKFRNLRNLVIHGMWSMDEKCLRKKRIPCFDFRWRKIESETAKPKSWKKILPEMFTFDRLRRNAVDVDMVVVELMKLCRDLKIWWMTAEDV